MPPSEGPKAAGPGPSRRGGRQRLRVLVRRLALALLPFLRRADERRRVAEDRAGSLAADNRRLEAELAQVRMRTAALGADPGREYGYVFVLSFGRSGSTLVQGLLNSIPGYLVRGENDFALKYLYEIHHRLLEARQRFTRGGRETAATHSWFGVESYTPELGTAAIREFVLATLVRPTPDARVVGFKEIRWWVKDWQGLLDFTREVFPGAKFVVNFRSVEHAMKSRWWGEDPKAREKLERYTAQLDDMAAYLGDDAHVVRFEEFVADPSVLEGLYTWLGEPFDLEQVRQVLSVRHSF